MKRYISLPAVGIRVGLGAYINGIKAAKQNTDAEFKHGLTCWWACKGKDIVKQFREGLNDRINQAIPAIQRGMLCVIRLEERIESQYGQKFMENLKNFNK